MDFHLQARKLLDASDFNLLPYDLAKENEIVENLLKTVLTGYEGNIALET